MSTDLDANIAPTILLESLESLAAFNALHTHTHTPPLHSFRLPSNTLTTNYLSPTTSTSAHCIALKNALYNTHILGDYSYHLCVLFTVLISAKRTAQGLFTARLASQQF